MMIAAGPPPAKPLSPKFAWAYIDSASDEHFCPSWFAQSHPVEKKELPIFRSVSGTALQKLEGVKHMAIVLGEDKDVMAADFTMIAGGAMQVILSYGKLFRQGYRLVGDTEDMLCLQKSGTQVPVRMHSDSLSILICAFPDPVAACDYVEFSRRGSVEAKVTSLGKKPKISICSVDGLDRSAPRVSRIETLHYLVKVRRCRSWTRRSATLLSAPGHAQC